MSINYGDGQHLENIYKRLTDIEIKLGVVDSRLENLHNAKNAAHAAIMDRLERLDHTIYGNSKIGIVTRVEEMHGLPAKVQEIEVRMGGYAVGASIVVLIGGQLLHWLLKTIGG